MNGFAIRCKKCNSCLVDVHATVINFGNDSQVKLVCLQCGQLICLQCGQEKMVEVVQVTHTKFHENITE